MTIEDVKVSQTFENDQKIREIIQFFAKINSPIPHSDLEQKKTIISLSLFDLQQMLLYGSNKIGYNGGYTDGYKKGCNESYDEGYDDGINDGYDDGKSDGYDDGYDDGRNEKCNEEPKE